MWFNKAVSNEKLIEATVEVHVPEEVVDRERTVKNLCGKIQEGVAAQSLTLDVMHNIAAERKIEFKVILPADSLDSADDLIYGIVKNAIDAVGGGRLIRQGLTHLVPVAA